MIILANQQEALVFLSKQSNYDAYVKQMGQGYVDGLKLSGWVPNTIVDDTVAPASEAMPVVKTNGHTLPTPEVVQEVEKISASLAAEPVRSVAPSASEQEEDDAFSVFDTPKTMLEWALWAVARGMYIFPCERGSKFSLTPNGYTDSTNDVDQIRKYWTAGTSTIIVRKQGKNKGKSYSVPGNPEYNYGVDLGKSDLAAYDYDTVNPYADTPATFTVKSGRVAEIGGYHCYYKGSCKSRSLFEPAVEPVTEKQLTVADEAVMQRFDALGRLVNKDGFVTVGEVRSRGQLVIGPGSIHKSGRPYTIISDVPFAPTPAQPEEKKHDVGDLISSDEQAVLVEFLEAAMDESELVYNRAVPYKDGLMWLVDCPWMSEHGQTRLISDGGSSTAVFLGADGKQGFKCSHAHCEHRHWAELRVWMESEVGRQLQFGPSSKITLNINAEVAAAVADKDTEIAAESFPDVADWMPTADICGNPDEPFQVNYFQTSMAELTLRLYGSKIRYVTIGEKGWWMRFNGKYWVDVGAMKIRELIRKSSKKITDELIPQVTGSTEHVEETTAWLRKLVANCHDTTFTNKVVQWMQEHQTAFEKFDQQDMKINFNNGTWDFNTGAFGLFNPLDYSTQIMSTNYNPASTCPTFLTMLANAFDNPEMPKFIQRYMGYCMLGTSKEKCFVLLHGRTDNGKTTLLEILAAILGMYAEKLEWESLSVSRAGAIRNDLAALHKSRFAYADEGAKKIQIAEEIVKMLSGTGRMKARFLNKEFFTFLIKFKMLLSTNDRPEFSPTDKALWNRVLDVYMPKMFSKGDPRRIENLAEKLWQEREGIAQFMLRGAIDFLEHGLQTPDEVKMNTETYRKTLDSVAEFLESCCPDSSPDGDHVAERTAVLQAYKNWAQASDKPPLGQNDFYRRIDDLGYKRTKSNNPRGFIGIVLPPSTNTVSMGGQS